MKHLKTFFGMLVLILTVSCVKTPTVTGGQVIFEVANNQQIVDVTKSYVYDYTTLPSIENFTITIVGDEYNWTGKVSEWNDSEELEVGNYSVTATYGSLAEEGFDKPYFIGTTTFTVIGGEETSVVIPVELDNTIIRMIFTDSFNNYYPDYTFKLTRDGEDIVTFVKGETKAAFIDAYKFTLEGTLYGEMKEESVNKSYSNLKVATAYTFNFDVTNVGGATITISFNDAVEVIELGDVELND